MEIALLPLLARTNQTSPTRLEGMEITVVTAATGYVLASPTRLEGMEMMRIGVPGVDAVGVSDPP